MVQSHRLLDFWSIYSWLIYTVLLTGLATLSLRVVGDENKIVFLLKPAIVVIHWHFICFKKLLDCFFCVMESIIIPSGASFTIFGYISIAKIKTTSPLWWQNNMIWFWHWVPAFCWRSRKRFLRSRIHRNFDTFLNNFHRVGRYPGSSYSNLSENLMSALVSVST